MSAWITKRFLISLSIAMAVPICIGVIYFATGLLDDELIDSQPSKARESAEILRAEVERITAESAGRKRELEIRSAPLTQPLYEDDAADYADGLLADSRYSYVKHFGEMNVAHMPRTVHRESLNEDEPVWLKHPNPEQELRRLARNAQRDWVFGWILLAPNASLVALQEQLNHFEAEIVGNSARMVRVKLPVLEDRLEMISGLSMVERIGFSPPETKVLAFKEQPTEVSNAAVPVYVTLMDEDPDDRWRQEMTRLGAVVGGYYQKLRVYRVNANQAVIKALAASDFVQAIEPIGVVEATHDTAVPAMGVSVLRHFDMSTRTFTGNTGASVPIGIMDTGLNINHLDIASNRISICGANFTQHSHETGVGRRLDADDDLWIDLSGHGTHVAGSVFGNGAQTMKFAGMAPGVQHIRIAKTLDLNGIGPNSNQIEAMRYFSLESTCDSGTGVSTSVLPLIVNMSLSAQHFTFQGRDVPARALDSTVWSTGQLYVVSQGNHGALSFSNYAASKNALAVGATHDSGKVAAFSGHGPTADGRLSPNVVGVGVRVYSAAGGGKRGGYRLRRGTSMSTPIVSGIAALLLDAVPEFRGFAALTRAQLMATAIRPEWWITGTSAFANDNTSGPGTIQRQYGLGKVSARTAMLDVDELHGWFSGSASATLEDGEYAYFDIDVPPDASGLDIVMTWDEPPGDAVVGTVLNDLDLWLDAHGDCETIACGEYSSRSKHDNVEWIFMRDPEPGTYRIKVLANAVYTTAPRAGIAWKVIRGSSTPTLKIEADHERIERNGEHEITLTLSADTYIAAGAVLNFDCRTAENADCSDVVSVENAVVLDEAGVRSSLKDESLLVLPPEYEVDPANDERLLFGSSLPLGEIAAHDERRIEIHLSVARSVDDPNLSLIFKVSAWNARSATTSVIIGTESAPNIVRPDNDHFATSTEISGENGTVSLDLLNSTPEPGEPEIDPNLDRRASSVWYTWQAPKTDRFSFRLPPFRKSSSILRRDYVHVFQGEHLPSLVPIASGLWHTSFRAEEGSTYLIRIAGLSRSIGMNLTWGLSSRPGNDDFVNALSLGGEPDRVTGTTSGSTLEAGEFFGVPAASNWYRWTAPDDGRWVFEASGQRVLAFTGESIPSLRLISDTPAPHADFPTRAGDEYFIMVGDIVEGVEGNDYELNWFRASHTGNDSFYEAEDVSDLESQRFQVSIDYYATVEPNEPLVTGVRTEWWVWNAPEAGRFAWRLEDTGEQSPSFHELIVSVFTGTDLSDLNLIAKNGPGAPYTFAFDATEGERIWIAVGLPTNRPSAYKSFQPPGQLAWETAPANDLVYEAAALTGLSGEISGNNAFATSETGERILGLGRSTLWWEYTAPTSGWFRFSVAGDGGGPWSLAVIAKAV